MGKAYLILWLQQEILNLKKWIHYFFGFIEGKILKPIGAHLKLTSLFRCEYDILVKFQSVFCSEMAELNPDFG